MTPRSTRTPKPKSRSTRLGIEALEDRTLPAFTSWLGGVGTWPTVGQWSAGTPNLATDATVSAATASDVSLTGRSQAASATVGGGTGTQAVNLVGNTLEVRSAVTVVAGGSISLGGGTIDVRGPLAFAPAVTTAAPGGDAILAADFNADGRTDAAVADRLGSSVTVLLSNGDGTFNSSSVGLTIAPRYLAAADFDGDGKLDLIAAGLDRDGVTLVVERGNGDGTFGVATTKSLGAFSLTGLAVGDFAGNGRVDIALANASVGGGVVLLRNTAGGLTRQDLPTGTDTPASLTAADLNKDGRLDIIATSYEGNVVVLDSRPGSTFGLAAYPATGTPRQAAVADVTGDGWLDVIAVDDGGDQFIPISQVRVFPNAGDGTLGPRTDFAVGAYAFATRVAAADFNGDGRPDLAVNSEGDGLIVLENLGGGAFAQRAFGAGQHGQIAVGNFAGDGHADLLSVVDVSGTPSVAVTTNTHARGLTTNQGRFAGSGVVAGNFSQAAGGTLDLTATSAAVYDKLTVTGAAALGGELRLTLAGGFTPTVGTSLDVLSATVTGSFAKVSVVNLPAGLKATPAYSAGGVRLTFESDVAPGGDAAALISTFSVGYANLRAELPDLAATVTGDGTARPVLPAGFTSALSTALAGLLPARDFSAIDGTAAGLRSFLTSTAGFTGVTVAADGTSAVGTLTLTLANAPGSTAGYALPYLAALPGTLGWDTTGATLTLTMGVDAAGFYVSTASGLSVPVALDFSADAVTVFAGKLSIDGASGGFTSAYTVTLADAGGGLARPGPDLAAGSKVAATGDLNSLVLDAEASLSVPGFTAPDGSGFTIPMTGTITKARGWEVTYDFDAQIDSIGLSLDQFQVNRLAFGISGTFASAADVTVAVGGEIVVNPDGNGDITVVVDGVFTNSGFAIAGDVRVAGDRSFGFAGFALALTDLHLTAAFGVNDWATPHVNAALSIDAKAASLSAPGGSGLSATGLSGFLDSSGQFSLTAATANLKVGDLLRIDVTGLAIRAGKGLPADTALFQVGTATTTLGFLTAALGGAPVVTVTDLTFRANGKFGLGGVSVSLPPGYTQRLGLADFLPFELDSLALTFPGGSAGSFDAFGVSIAGKFNVAAMTKTFGFTPIISVGKEATLINGAFSADLDVLSAKAGKVQLRNFGPIRLGFAGLKIGVVTLNGAITLGGVKDGVLVETASLDVSVASTTEFGGFSNGVGASLDSFALRADGSIVRDPVAGTVTLNLATAVQVGLHVKLAGFFQLDDIGFKARISLTTPTADFAPTFKFNLDGISVGNVSVGFDQYVRLAARNVVFNFTGDENVPLATIGTASLSFAVPGTGATPIGITGSIANLQFTQKGLPRLNGLAVVLQFSGLDSVFSWFPVQVKKLGLKIGDMFFEDAAGNPTGVKNLADFTLIFSGGFDGSKSVLPIVATITDVALNVGKLARGEFPVENLGGISFGVLPFNLGPVRLGGLFSFGSVVRAGLPTIYYGRLVGEFSYEGLGAGIDVVISDRGPVVATLSIPLGIPLDPFGITLLSGATGSLTFGVTEIVTPQQPEDIANLSAPVTTITDALITAQLAKLGEGAYTWDKSIALTLTGTVITPYAPGVISGDLTVGAYLGTDFASASGGLKFFAIGEFNVFGLTFASAKFLVDFGKILEPRFAGLVQVPDPSNPLGFLFPAKATAGAFLSTEGVAPAYLAAVGAFVDAVAKGTASVANDFFASSLDLLVTRLREDYDRPLSKIIFDTNGDDFLSAAERLAPKNFTNAQLRKFFLDRVVELLPKAENLFSNTATTAELEKGVRLATAIVGEVLYTAGLIFRGEGLGVLGDLARLNQSFNQEVVSLFRSDGQRAVLAFCKVMLDALKASNDTFARRLLTDFDPKFLLRAKIQPVVFGIPVGQSPLDGEVIIDKNHVGVSLNLRIPLRTLVTAPLTPIIGPVAFLVVPIPELTFDGTFGLNFPFGDVAIDALVNGVPAIDPNAGGWTAQIEGGVSFGAVRLLKTGALIFPADWEFLAAKVQSYDATDPNATIDTDKIQVTPEHYASLKRYGGVLGYSAAYLPKFVTDPVAAFANVTPPPSDPALILEWLDSVRDAFEVQVEVGRAQFFLPSLASILEFNLVDFDKLTAGDANGLKPKIGIRDGKTDADAIAILKTAYLEGKLNGKLLGVEFATADLEADATGLRVRGNVSWLGNASVVFSVGSRTQAVAGKPDITVPTIVAELDLDTTENLRAVFKSWGLDSNALPLLATTKVKFRGYSPGYDTSSPELIQRTGGLELEASLRVNGLVDEAAFKFRLTPPAAGQTVPLFTAVATVTNLKLFNVLGVFTIASAEVTVTNTDAAGKLLPNGRLLLKVKGTGQLNGQTVTVDGVLNPDLTGFLTLTVTGQAQALDLIDGFSLTGTFRIDLTRPAGALQVRLGFDGRLTPPSWLGTGALAAVGFYESTGKLDLTLTTTGFSLAGFTLSGVAGKPLLKLTRDAGRNASVTLEVHGQLTVGTGRLQVVAVDGTFNSKSGGKLTASFGDNRLDFGGLNFRGTATLDLTRDGSRLTGKLTLAGTLNVPGFVTDGTVTGTLDPSLYGNLTVTAKAVGGVFGLLQLKDATLTVGRDAQGLFVKLAGNLTILGDKFAASGSFRYTPTASLNPLAAIDGQLSLSRTKGTASKSDLVVGGWGLFGTVTLTVKNGTALLTITNGTLTLPLVQGTASVNGTLTLDGVGTLALDLGPTGLDFGGVSLQGSFRFTSTRSALPLSPLVVALQGNGLTLTWAGLGTLAVKSFSSDSLGNFDAAVDAKTLEIGPALSLKLPGARIVSRPASLEFALRIDAPEVTVNFGPKPTTVRLGGGLDVPLNSGDFRKELPAINLQLGELVKLVGKLTLARKAGVVTLELAGVNGGPATVALFGLVNAVVSSLSLSTDGTVNLKASLNTFGTDLVRIKNAAVALSVKPVNGRSRLDLTLTGGVLDLIGDANDLTLPTLTLAGDDKQFTGTVSFPFLRLGPLNVTANRLKVTIRDGFLAVDLLDPAVVVFGGAVVTIDSLAVSTKGTFAGTARGQLFLGNVLLADATFAVGLNGTDLRLSGSSSFQTKYLTIGVSGFYQSNGTFDFAATTTIAVSLPKLSFRYDGRVTVALRVPTPGAALQFSGLATGTITFVKKEYDLLDVAFDSEGNFKIGKLTFKL